MKRDDMWWTIAAFITCVVVAWFLVDMLYGLP